MKYLYNFICTQKRLPMGYAAIRLSQEINGVLLLLNLDKKVEGQESEVTPLTLLEEVLKNW